MSVNICNMFEETGKNKFNYYEQFHRKLEKKVFLDETACPKTATIVNTTQYIIIYSLFYLWVYIYWNTSFSMYRITILRNLVK